jgi:peptide/nickel transport system permease protein
VRIAVAFLIAMVVLAVFAPWLGTRDPAQLDPVARLQGPSLAHFLGTDALGRDVYSRIVFGARVSLLVGAGVAILSVAAGLVLGMIAGYFPIADALVMRVMDGVMAIPGILLAIALVALMHGSLITVIFAITVPEIPRVVRLVRGVVISVRNEPYVEAAIVQGTPPVVLLVRHMTPNTVAPLIVQGTFILAAAMLAEAAMSFLGVGLPPETPSWGNIMADARSYFQIDPGLIFFPGFFLTCTVLSINVVGDAVRDALDPWRAGAR